MQKRFRLPANIHKGFCGLLIALAFIALPLPALADNQTTEQPAAETTAAPAENQATTPDLSLAQPTVENTPTLQSAPATNTDQSATSLQSDVPASAPSTSVQVENNVDSQATSGTATVTSNETAGDATSGNTSATATIVNVVNASGVSAGGFQTLECDITGDIQGNILVDPASLQQITGAAADCTSTSPDPSAVPTSTGGLQTGASLVDILNNIILSATSGDATVDGNETAGNASTGNASALANIVNIANTAIGSQNSFLGVLNIYGNLEGNILVPQSFVDSLVTNSGASGTVNNTTITNNISASATSGNATVGGNETAGDATTGNAMTSLTVMNLTGQEVVAKNSLLVFVNVLGRWMGMIVPAPGSTTAMLGSGVQNSTGSGQSAGDTTTNITNNITVEARSGDANVTNNDTAGDATTGNAAAGVNLLNITDSNFFLQDWFGALFINVLGSWIGNFDILANPPAPSGSPAPPQPVQDVRVFRFTEPVIVRPAATTAPRTAAAAAPTTTDITEEAAPSGTVLGATVDTPSTSEDDKQSVNLNLVALGALVLVLTLLIALGTSIIRRRFAA